MERSV
jgi:hypothetical protein